MNYPYRNTYKKDTDTYIEDRGFLFSVSRGDELFGVVDAQFGSLLQAGQTAVRSLDGEGWDVVDGDAVTPVYSDPLAKMLRAKRDSLLAKTDYIFMPDYNINDDIKTAMKVYRQALRDITGQKGWPFDVAWPVLPSEE